MQWHWPGKPKYWETNLWQCHCVHYKPHVDCLGSNTCLQGDRPATNFLSHGAACCIVTTGCLCPAPYRPQQGAPKVFMKFSAALWPGAAVWQLAACVSRLLQCSLCCSANTYQCWSSIRHVNFTIRVSLSLTMHGTYVCTVAVPGATTARFCCYVIPLHSIVSCPQFVITTVCFAQTHTHTHTHIQGRSCACVPPRFSTFAVLKGFRLNLVRGAHKDRMLLKWVCNKKDRGGGGGLYWISFFSE